MNTLRLSSSSPLLYSRTFLFLRLHISSSRFDLTRSLHFSNPNMPKPQRKNRHNELNWQVKSRPDEESASASAQEVHNGQSHDTVPPSKIRTLPPNQNRGQNQKVLTTWRPKSYGTMSGLTGIENKSVSVESAEVAKNSVGSSKISRDSLLANFTVDDSTYSHAQIRATFYPKFENEKSDQEIRTRMIEIVSKGVATLEVSLKHSGSLFMYAGHEGGAYAKNSFGNIYTAVGVFVLGRMFHEAWGTKAGKKQAEFNEFLEHNRMCISMELVTAVLGDHGQRPKEDYVVVTAVTELGNGKPKFYSTPQIIAFCRKWRLPTNHVWLFSTRKSVTSLFAAYDALYEEGTATSVCKALDEVADISVSGSIDHIKVQGDILEGLVARIVSCESSNYMEEVLRDFPSHLMEKHSNLVTADSGPSLREICAANRSNEKQQVKALLQSVGTSFCPDQSDWFGDDYDNLNSKNADRSVFTKILQAHPADYSTKKLQEMVSLMSKKSFPAAFKCHHNFHKTGSTSSENLFIKMVIHVRSDSAFKRYNKLMSHNPDLWPLYRGFFVDINLFKANKDKAAEIAKNSSHIVPADASRDTSGKNDVADEDANLMIKLKFLTYKLRTFLIRNGLSILFKDGSAAYKAYYMRQLKLWGTSAEKQKELIKLLDEWAVYIRRKYGTKQLSSSIYLSEAEPFLEQFAKRRPENRILIGSAGNLIKAEDFLALVEGGRDEEGDLEREMEVSPSSPSPMVKETVPKNEGLVVFFPGIPGCAKSALCKEITSAPERLRDDRPVHSLMGDLIKGKYWQKVVEELKRKPYSIMLADKNAPDEQVWTQIEDMCRSTRSSAVPVVADSEGTDSNPFSLDALAVFMFRVLQRDNHPGKLDKATPFAGYVLLLFYNLYEGKSRREFEAELVERFGSIVKMPLLKPDRNPLPGPVKSVLEEGINLYDLHTSKHGRKDPTKGTYTTEWTKWEKCLRDVLSVNAAYLNSIQVPFEFAVEQVLEQLRNVAKGECKMPSTEKRKSGNIIFAAIDLPVTKIEDLLNNIAKNDPKLEAFLAKIRKDNLKKTHVTLAHKGPHGVTAVANFGMFLHQNVPVEMTALLFTDKMAALEVCIGSIEGEKIISKNEWPHITLWTAQGVAAKLANTLPQLFSEGKATCIQINPPVSISGVVEFY